MGCMELSIAQLAYKWFTFRVETAIFCQVTQRAQERGDFPSQFCQQAGHDPVLLMWYMVGRSPKD